MPVRLAAQCLSRSVARNCAGVRIGRLGVEDEEVLVAGDEVRATADRESEEIVVVGIARADRRRACGVLSEGSVVTDQLTNAAAFSEGILLRSFG